MALDQLVLCIVKQDVRFIGYKGLEEHQSQIIIYRSNEQKRCFKLYDKHTCTPSTDEFLKFCLTQASLYMLLSMISMCPVQTKGLAMSDYAYLLNNLEESEQEVALRV